MQESSVAADDSLSNKKKSAILESSIAAYGSASNKKKSSDDKNSYVEETDTTTASKDITPSPQPASLFQSKSPSVHCCRYNSTNTFDLSTFSPVHFIIPAMQQCV
ncbi:hypothetical protein CHS0354_021931 [Potamilus streckersoni]|uniref:Uncharacterized protein n=1 Tax=Potamilus streckersoni TaxID=2493646 RepID=A0AAE0SL25_9BIVA|nr:hypothetical protein CHS0354_021931 [Potamilus streckersoni]